MHVRPIILSSLNQLPGTADRPSSPEKFDVVDPPGIVVEPVAPIAIKVESVIPSREELKDELRKETEVSSGWSTCPRGL